MPRDEAPRVDVGALGEDPRRRVDEAGMPVVRPRERPELGVPRLRRQVDDLARLGVQDRRHQEVHEGREEDAIPLIELGARHEQSAGRRRGRRRRPRWLRSRRGRPRRRAGQLADDGEGAVEGTAQVIDQARGARRERSELAVVVHVFRRRPSSRVGLVARRHVDPAPVGDAALDASETGVERVVVRVRLAPIRLVRSPPPERVLRASEREQLGLEPEEVLPQTVVGVPAEPAVDGVAQIRLVSWGPVFLKVGGVHEQLDRDRRVVVCSVVLVESERPRGSSLKSSSSSSSGADLASLR
mmetsp:Transcript_1569/g.6056  ORF Transcript_1569/g.6056 Transcript_1569/m.6056 type:complete len:299 (-) Transcript_1569:369-1265(-)